MTFYYYKSPVGYLQIAIEEEKIHSIDFMDDEFIDPGQTNVPDKLFDECSIQLTEYFEGKRKKFSLPLSFAGTTFQQRVWRQLSEIPFGKTWSYLDMAIKLGDPKCIRAAASANGKNPFSIVIPCHRVIGKNGSLTGYAGGLWRKKWLLDHENKYANGLRALFD